MNQSVNDIELNGLLIENLYRRSLVQLNDEVNAQLPEVRFLGNNEKNITILVNDPGNTFMPEGHLAFLTKILGACKLNIGDVAIVNMAHSVDLHAIVSNLNPSRVITFGIELKITGIENVAAPAINELIAESEEAKAQKAKLWNGLKQMFGL